MEKGQKIHGSVFWLTGGVVVLIFVFKLIFGAMYPQDSYRSYQNEEITTLSPENFFQEEKLKGLQDILEGKGKRTAYLQEITEIRTDSGGIPISVDLRLLTFAKGDTEKYVSYHLTLEQEKPGELVREEGYHTLEMPMEDFVPFSFLTRLGKGPLKELANTQPIAHDNGYRITMLPNKGECIAIQDKQENGELLIDSGCYFIRLDEGYFQISDANQISQRYLSAEVSGTENGEGLYHLIYEAG